MNINDIKPACEFAQNFGVKAVIYGKAGAAKTPIALNTAPKPLLLLSEPGLLSVKKSTAATFPAFNPARVDEFFAWWLGSREADRFDSLIWDSVSQSAERKVEEELGVGSKAGNEAHGMRAYGNMSRWMMGHLGKLYFQPNKHIFLICKMQNLEVNGMIYRRPYFPGKELPVRVPHLFDYILELGDFNVPGVTPSPTKAFRTKEAYDAMARARSDDPAKWAEYEPPNLTKFIAKAMS